MDMAGNITIAQTGVQSVPVFTTGHDKSGLQFVSLLWKMASLLLFSRGWKGCSTAQISWCCCRIIIVKMNEKLTEIWVDKT